MLDIKDFSFTYSGSENKALRSLNLKVEQGTILAVIGANKSGKSSMCYALAGVIPHLYGGAVQGYIRIANKDTQNVGVAEMSTVVALLMQNSKLQLSGVRFTVREEIAFALENQGLSPDMIRRRVEDIMRRTDLSDFAQCVPHRLSEGQMQQVALAAALVTNTPVLVLDEPISFLDPVKTQKVFTLLKQLSRQGKTIIIAEQRLNEIAVYADRVIALHDGSVVLDGPPGTVLVSSKLKEIGLDRNRYTKVARLAQDYGLWRDDEPLPVTLEATLRGLGKE